MKKKELPVLSVILYIMAAISAIGAVGAAYDVLLEIANALSSGYITFFGDFTLIVSYCMSGFMAYLIYALLLCAAGVILQHVATMSGTVGEMEHMIHDASEEAGLDEVLSKQQEPDKAEWKKEDND